MAAVSFLLMLCASSASVPAQQIGELRNGKWIEIAATATAPTTSQAPEPDLLKIEQLIASGQNKAAQKAAVAWLLKNPKSRVRDRGLFLMAEALYQYGDRIKAFYYLDELLDTYAESALFYPAVEKQYQIADEYLNGYKRRLLWMPVFGAEEEAVEMLFRIQQRVPKSPLADKSLLRTCDYYYASSQYDLAADAYRAYAESYPRSPKLPRVKLRQAYSNLAQFRGAKFDSTPIIDAKAQLEDIVRTYPDLATDEGLPALISRIDNTFARKLAITADFYRRTNQPRGASYTYQFLVNNYPNTPEAAKAQEALVKLPPSVLSAPPSTQAAVPTAAPASQPGTPMLPQ
jgi:outer membrane assembly lipoprotein YfiO